jgi:predicted ferric reductase/Ca2+-binding EF-hand superfamily protein
VDRLSLRERWRAGKSFRAIAGRDRLIDYREWKSSLGIENDLFANRLFHLIDVDDSAFIDRQEFMAFVRLLRKGTLEERLAFVFDVYDLQMDGEFGRKEIRQVLDASLAEQGLALTDEVANKLVNAFMRKADFDRDRKITRADFVAMARDFPRASSQLDQFASIWLGGSARQSRDRTLGAPLSLRLKRGLEERAAEYLWLILYMAANTVLAAEAADRYAAIGAPVTMQLARAAGACLNLNAALILIPMCRATWSWLRHTFVARLVPIDSMTQFHRLAGYAIVGFSMVHVGAHLVNFWNQRRPMLDELLLTTAGLTGVLMALVLYVMVRGVHNRNEHRELFGSSHLLYGLLIGALLVHAPQFWMWLVAPLAVFLLDCLARALFQTRHLRITSLTPLADGVTSVVMEKPKRMRFYPGDYLRLQVPGISRWEWHPFTISAAPETSRIAVHVRNNGDWSGALHNLSRRKDRPGSAMRARIDGPYGAPTSSVYRSKVAILVAGGIGVTPFASVLHSLLLRRKSTHETGRTLYFHWLNRSQRSYEWFVDLLDQAERQLGEEQFRLFIHLTSLSHNLSNIAMQIAVDAYRERYGRDPLTHLRAVTSAGRPNWERIFAEVAVKHAGMPVDVYFCGPPGLGKALRRAAAKFGFYYHEEKFD